MFKFHLVWIIHIVKQNWSQLMRFGEVSDHIDVMYQIQSLLLHILGTILNIPFLAINPLLLYSPPLPSFPTLFLFFIPSLLFPSLLTFSICLPSSSLLPPLCLFLNLTQLVCWDENSRADTCVFSFVVGLYCLQHCGKEDSFC